MKFSFEVPIPHLEDFEDLQDFHFVLPQLLEDPRYRSFLLEHRDKELWMDNGYNELGRPYPVHRLVQLAKELERDGREVNYIISPDSLDWNLPQFLDAMYSLIREWDKSKICGVVLGPTWKTAYEELGITKMAIPYEVRPGLFSLGELTKMHFLALRSPEELLYLNPASVDTAMPIKLAVYNLTWEEWKAAGGQHLDFPRNYWNMELTPEQLELARKNIMEVRKYAEVR